MSKFQELWKSKDGRIGKALQLVVEYETKENGRNIRAFETQVEYDQWCLEMGDNIKVISMRKGGDRVPLFKNYIVRVNGEDHGCWEDEKEAKGYLQMLREGGTFGVLLEQTVVGMTEKGAVKKDSLLQKPGGSAHTAKWDSCVAHVKESNPGADPYAVCTAMLGDESFKAMDESNFNAVIDKALGQIGISAAGPIPNSKLARQDLEGSTKKSFGSFTPTADLVSRIKSNQKAPVTKRSSFRDAWSKIKPR